QIPAGLAIDAIGIKKALLISLGLIWLASLLPLASMRFYFVLGTRCLAGIGTGVAFLAGMKYATVFTDERYRGAVQGVFGAAFSMGAILPFLIMPRLVEYGWRAVFLSTSLFFLLPICLLLLWGKESDPGPGFRWSDFAPVFKNRAILLLGLFHAVHFGGVITLGTWFSPFAIELSGKGLWLAGIMGALVMLVSAGARIFGGLIMRWMRSEEILKLSFGILILCYLGLNTLENFYAALLVYSLGIFMSSVTFGPIFYLSSVVSGMDRAATGFGIVNFIANIGSLIFPVVFGLFIDFSGVVRSGFLFMAGLSTIGFGLTLIFRKMEKRPAQYSFREGMTA
ncbi:MAG: MFS transporter, partial [Deltaproteobacteria bacterium]|nr:MFS transporter [Deltaproteobacteria bacterium]